MRSLIGAFVAVCLLAGHADAKPICGFERQESLLDRFLQSEMLVVGTFKNAVGPNNNAPNGQSELVIDEILIPGKAIDGRKSIFVDRRVETKEKFLVAMEVYKGQIDAYTGQPLDDKGEILRYIRGAAQLKDKSREGRLRYNVDFLHSANADVARSALLEIDRASYAEVGKIAKTLEPAPLAKALQGSNLPAHNRSRIGMLLGHCGKKEHAVILRKLIDDRERKGFFDGLLVGYALLEPDAGWQLIGSWSEKKDAPFLDRYSALQAMRVLIAERPDLVDAKKGCAGLARFFKDPELADFAIEDLRKLKRWEQCDTILALYRQTGYDTPIMRRAILRYALQCPSAAAMAHVQSVRALDPEFVTDTEELLELEEPPAKK